MKSDVSLMESMIARPLPVIRRFVDQEAINVYAAASGDFNPIHVDPEYARSGPYGRTIAHGLMTLGFVGQMLRDWSGGDFDENGEIDVAFVAPALAGETVEVSGEVEGADQRNGEHCIKVKINAMSDGRRILAGYAYQFFGASGCSSNGA